MAETKGAVNRVWMSVDTGSQNFGPKISFFAGGDTPDEVIAHFTAAFGGEPTDTAIGKLMSVLSADLTAAAVGNVQAAGMVGNNQAPASDPSAPVCNHGAMQYKTGTSAKGPWKAWFCPAPKGDPSQCKAKFL